MKIELCRLIIASAIHHGCRGRLTIFKQLISRANSTMGAARFCERGDWDLRNLLAGNRVKFPSHCARFFPVGIGQMRRFIAE
jgi:hypothetical protein